MARVTVIQPSVNSMWNVKISKNIKVKKSKMVLVDYWTNGVLNDLKGIN